MIGIQENLYQENERIHPINNGHGNVFSRSLLVDVPKHYEVVNLDEFNYEFKEQLDSTNAMSFTVKSVLLDSVISVQIEESYPNLNISVEKYESFRKIINAAADFNKKVLIFRRSI